MGMRQRLQQRCSRIAARMRRESRSGAAAIEFAVVAPVLFLFLFGIIETGVLYFAGSTLQNATDNVARQIRTGQLTGQLDANILRTQICSQITGLISNTDCMNNLQVDLHDFTGFGGASYANVINADGSINTGALQVSSPSACTVVLMRTFYPWTIMTPLMSPLLSNMPNGQHLLISAAAFRTEPYVSGQQC